MVVMFISRIRLIHPFNIYIYIYIYIDPNIFMVSWWGTNSYLNNEHIKIGDTEIMTAAYSSSGSFE